MTRFPNARRHYDAVIIGARCAGAATALLLARAGARVLLVDRQKYGSDTISTHALMRGAVLQLRRWGLLPEVIAAGSPEIRRTTFHYGEERIPVAIKPGHGIDALCAPRRDLLDRILVDAAAAAGAHVHHQVSLAGLRFGLGGRVTGVRLKTADGAARDSVEVDADLVIGADGRQSTVARIVDAPFTVEGSWSSGYVYGYFRDLPDDGTHWHFAPKAAAGIIPTNHAQHCVFVAVPRAAFAATFRGDLEGGFARVARANGDAFQDRIGWARRVGRLRGFACAPGYLRQAHGPGWALVGDAAYFKDPLTAHGITDALRDAELLARAALDGSPAAFARYQEARDALSRPLLAVTDAIAAFDWSLEEVKDHHTTLSEAMRTEVEHIARLETLPPLAA